jgi:hypothetical protein
MERFGIEHGELRDSLIGALNRIGVAPQRLGNKNAATELEAIEVLSADVRRLSDSVVDGCEQITGALRELAAVVRDKIV